MSVFAKWTGPVLMGAIALTGAWSAVKTEWSLGDGFQDGATQAAWQDQFDEGLAIRTGAINAWGSAFWALFGQTSPGAVPGRDGWLFTDEEYQAAPGFEARLTQSLAQIAEAKAQVEGQGAALIIALLPDKARIMGDKLERPRAPQVAARYDALLNGLAARDIQVLDLRPALTEARAEAPVFLRTDTHWTPFGARTVARALAPALQELTPAPTAFETEQTELAEHRGDLMRYLPLLAPDSAGFPAEPLPRFTTVAGSGDLLGGGGGGGLFGDAPSPAILVGTSFSANPNWHFDGWLKQESGLDIINHADEGEGPFPPMERLLPQLGDLSPPVVIWELPERYLTLSD